LLHHVSIEVAPAQIERATEFWRLLGFTSLQPPPALSGSAVWLERQGTQVHLISAENPTVPDQGHLAVIPPDFETALARLREAGFEVSGKRELWGSPRALAIAPGGHRVELIRNAP
jgi:hypothetical protein